MTVKSVALSFIGWFGRAAASASAAEAPQIAVAPPVSRPNSPRNPSSRAEAQQRDADAQHLLGGELDAGAAGPVGREEIHRHAQQQREQHHRRAVVLRKERRRRADDGTGEHAGSQHAQAVRCMKQRTTPPWMPGRARHDNELGFHPYALGRRRSWNCSRSLFFCILPVAPSGIASMNTTSSGVHHLAILPS
ncbi:MAG: hypothetical protein K0Q43_5404 [Ramlibacter sp.]|nr:hypothetical protein [Ramlibacter sp.]